jgi:hypothetical protein
VPKSPKSSENSHADKEYKRLLEKYKNAAVDDIKLQINDSLIRKVAELYGTLESLNSLPKIIFDRSNPKQQKETAAGKMYVKYMAQYVNAMQKLNKELLGTLEQPDNDLDEYEDK